MRAAVSFTALRNSTEADVGLLVDRRNENVAAVPETPMACLRGLHSNDAGLLVDNAHFLGRDRNAREAWRGHPTHQTTIDFCEKYGQPAFDPAMRSMPRVAFEPIVRRLLARPLRSWNCPWRNEAKCNTRQSRVPPCRARSERGPPPRALK